MDKPEDLSIDSSPMLTQETSPHTEQVKNTNPKLDPEEASLKSKQFHQGCHGSQTLDHPAFQDQPRFDDARRSTLSEEIEASSEQLHPPRPPNTSMYSDIHTGESYYSMSQFGPQFSAQTNAQDLRYSEVQTGSSQVPYHHYTHNCYQCPTPYNKVPRPQEPYHYYDPNLSRLQTGIRPPPYSSVPRPYDQQVRPKRARVSTHSPTAHAWTPSDQHLIQQRTVSPQERSPCVQGQISSDASLRQYRTETSPQEARVDVSAFGSNDSHVPTQRRMRVSPQEPTDGVQVSGPNYHLSSGYCPPYKMAETNVSSDSFHPIHGYIEAQSTSHSHEIRGSPYEFGENYDYRVPVQAPHISDTGRTSQPGHGIPPHIPDTGRTSQPGHGIPPHIPDTGRTSQPGHGIPPHIPDTGRTSHSGHGIPHQPLDTGRPSQSGHGIPPQPLDTGRTSQSGHGLPLQTLDTGRTSQSGHGIPPQPLDTGQTSQSGHGIPPQPLDTGRTSQSGHGIPPQPLDTGRTSQPGHGIPPQRLYSNVFNAQGTEQNQFPLQKPYHSTFNEHQGYSQIHSEVTHQLGSERVSARPISQYGNNETNSQAHYGYAGQFYHEAQPRFGVPSHEPSEESTVPRHNESLLHRGQPPPSRPYPQIPPPPPYSSVQGATETMTHQSPSPGQHDGALVPKPTHPNVHTQSSALAPVHHPGSQMVSPEGGGSEVLQYGLPATGQTPKPCSTITNYNVSSETVSLSGNVTMEHPELSIMKSQTKELLRKWCPNFVVTTGYDQAKRILDSYGHVTLIGEPGSGKTTIAHQLLKSNMDTFMPFIIEESSELRLRDPKESTLVLFNDIFGKASYSKKIDTFLSLLEQLTKTLNKKRFRVIFTSRNYIFSAAKEDLPLYQDTLFNENSIVDLSGDDCLIESDKQNILESYLKKEKIRLSKEDIQTIVTMKSSYGFPHACSLFSTMKRWHMKPVEFFRKPIDVVIESLQHMYSMDQERFTIFLLLLMSKGTVNIAKLRKVSNVSEEVREFIGEDVVRSFLRKKHELVPSLLGCYLNANGEQYSFRHPTVEDTVAFVVGKKEPLFLIENCSMRVINERVRIHTTSGKGTQGDAQWFYVLLADEYHEDLVKRFVKEIKERNFSMVCLHQACSQDRFVDELFESLKEQKDYTQLMHNYDRQYNQNMLYWCAMNKSDVMFGKIVENTMFRPYEEHNAIIVCCMTGNTKQLKTLLGRLSPARMEKLIRMSITRRGIVIKQEDFEKHEMFDDRLLNIAARHGHKDVVDMLVGAGFSVSGEQNSIPPLHSCCETGHVNILVHLHGLGAQLDGKRFDRKTPLHIACKNGHFSMVKKCIELGATAASVDQFGQTPLLMACENGHEDIAKFLLDSCPISDEGKYEDVLYYACQGGCFDVVKDIVTNNVNVVQENLGTLLHSAAKKRPGHDIEDRKLEIIKFLLEKDSDVNAVDANGNTPLLIAAENGYLNIVNILIEHGAQLSVLDDDGHTFIHKAAEGNLLHRLKYSPADLKLDIDETNRNGQTPLHRAAMAEATQSIKYLLRKKADINAVDKSNHTPLHLASVNEGDSAVKALLDNKADVDPKNDLNQTPLHYASAEGRLETTRTLLQHKADVNATNVSGQTPLHLASSTWIGGVDVVQLLLAHSADVHARNLESQTPLHLSVGAWGRVDTTQALLDHLSDVNAQDETMRTPLHLATLKGHVDVIQLLVDRGADVDVTDNLKQTALHLAAENSDIITVQVLLDCKANVEAADENGLTPLHLASTVGRHHNVALLLKTADMYAQDRDGETALHAAAVEGKTKSIEVLIASGMNINIPDTAGKTPLHTCCVNGRPEAAAVFLDKGADITARDKGMRTPLHLAAECDRPSSDEIVTMLLDHGADVNAEDDHQATPLHCAALKGLCESVQVLLRCSADTNAKDSFRNTALHLAVSASRFDIVQELLHSDALCDIMDINGNLAIHLAAKSPQTDAIKIMLRHKVDTDARDVDMKTALHVATSGGNAKTVRLLISKGANVNPVDSQNQTPLHHAVVKGDNNIVQQLIDCKVDLDIVDVNGKSALDLAKEGGKLSTVTLLSRFLKD